MGIYMDGTKIKGGASSKMTKDRAVFDKWVYMKSGGSKDVLPGCICQTPITKDGIIVAFNVVAEENDHDQLETMFEQTESKTGKKVSEATADSGYGGYASYEYLEEIGIDGYVQDMYFHQYKSGEYMKK